MAFAGYAGILCGKYGQIPQGLRLGHLAIELSQQLGNPREHQTQYLYNAYVRHFKDPLRICADSLFDYHIKALEGVISSGAPTCWPLTPSMSLP